VPVAVDRRNEGLASRGAAPYLYMQGVARCPDVRDVPDRRRAAFDNRIAPWAWQRPVSAQSVPPNQPERLWAASCLAVVWRRHTGPEWGIRDGAF
jgi:hypothetical protein